MKIICILLFTLCWMPAFTQKTAPSVATQHNNSAPLQTPPSFISPILKIPFRGAIVPPLPAQAKDRLLWYTGKKVDDSILVTTDARLVLYSRNRDIVIVEPATKKRDPSFTIVKEMANTQKRKDDFYDKVMENKGNVMMYPAIANTLTEFDLIVKRFEDMVKNYVNLPPSLNTNASVIKFTSSGAASTSYNYFFTVPEYVKKAYNEVLADKKNYPPIDFPAPPARDFGACQKCDTTAKSKYDDTENDWQKQFVKYEAGIINKSLSIVKTIANLNLEADPEAVQIITGVTQAMEFANARISNKVDLLIRKYGNDFTRLSSVIRAAISAERQKQLLAAVDEDTYSKTMARLLAMFTGFDKYIDAQIAARNYDVVLNLAFIIGVERQRQLLAGDEENNMPDLIEKINAFNRFKLDVQIDYEGEWEGCGIEKAEFTATNLEEFYVSLGLVNCKYNFFLAGEYLKDHPRNYHYGNPYNIRLQVTNGTGTQSKYSEDGEKCWQLKPDLKGLTIAPYEPIASISFCEKDTEDSLQFYSLHLPNSRENRENENYNHAKFEHFDTRLENDGYTGNEPAEFWQMQTELEELKGSVGKFEMKTYTKPTLAEMEEHHFVANRIKWLTKMRNEYEERSNPSVIIFDAKNGSETIIDEKSTKKYSDAYLKEKAEVVIRVKITHAPVPYKKPAKNN